MRGHNKTNSADAKSRAVDYQRSTKRDDNEKVSLLR